MKHHTLHDRTWEIQDALIRALGDEAFKHEAYRLLTQAQSDFEAAGMSQEGRASSLRVKGRNHLYAAVTKITRKRPKNGIEATLFVMTWEEAQRERHERLCAVTVAEGDEGVGEA